jgi:hypothetical protein
MWLLVLAIITSSYVNGGRSNAIEVIQMSDLDSYETCVSRAEAIKAKNPSFTVGQDSVVVVVNYNCFENKPTKLKLAVPTPKPSDVNTMFRTGQDNGIK